MRIGWLACVLCVAAVGGYAVELHADMFAETPAPAKGELAAPRLLAVNQAGGKCFVLDSAAGQVSAFTLEGRSVSSRPLGELGLDALADYPPDPMLADPAFAVAKGTTYLLRRDRPNHQLLHLFVTPVDGAGAARDMTLPDGATSGAVTLDPGGQVVVAYIRFENNAAALELAREGDDGAFTTIGALTNPCEGQSAHLNLTGITISPEGQLAVGIAQTGDWPFTFIRSWLVQGGVNGNQIDVPLQTTHRCSVLDARGKLLDRYRALIKLAGAHGYPLRPCVPLFTSLAFGPDGVIVSGGHTLDPFLRVFSADGHLLASRPHVAVGGQRLASLTRNSETHLLAIDAEARRITETTLDGRVVGGFGNTIPFDLGHPLALAADDNGLYAAVRQEGMVALLRFDTGGQFCWHRWLTPPVGMELAEPVLAAPSADSVFVGWRQPKAAGVGYVESIMADGAAGAPLWETPYTGQGKQTISHVTPLVTGANGRLYVMQQSAKGALLQSYTSSGTLLLQYSPDIPGITAVAPDGTMGWVHADEDGLVISRFTARGGPQGWKRVLGAAHDALFLPVLAREQWAWLSSTSSFKHYDEEFAEVGEATLTMPDGNPLDPPLAITGNRQGRIYIALTDKLLLVAKQ